MRLNLSNAIATWAERSPDKIAIGGTFSITYKQLDQMANYVANSISKLPYSEAKKIAILEPNSALFIAALAGIIRSGSIYVLINQSFDDKKIENIMQTVECNCYLAKQKHSIHNAEWIPFSEECSVEYCCATKEMGILDDVAVFFSSGTTGSPKALLRSNYSVLSEIIQWIIELQLSRESSFLIPRPLYYTGGFVLAYATLFVGGCVSFLNDISTEVVVKNFEKNDYEWSLLVPSVIREMLTIDCATKVSKFVLTMGDTIFSEEKLAFQKKYGCDVVEVWGNTEGLGTITSPSDLFSNPNSVGRAFFTDFIDVAPINSNIQSLECEGVLYGKSDNAFSEYIGNPTLTSKTIMDGWIISEDIGKKDRNGFVYLRGRLNDSVIVGDKFIFLQQIEQIIRHNAAISDVAVFVRNKNDISQAIYAAVVSAHKLVLGNLLKEINDSLEGQAKIQNIVQISEIPRNHGGKVDDTKLLMMISNEE